jgi:hypothetical protein
VDDVYPPYTKRLHIRNAPVTGNETIYTCPVGFTTIVRDIVLYRSATTGTFLWITLLAGPGAMLYSSTIGGTEKYDRVELRQAMNPGDTLVLTSDWPDIQMLITGYVLTLPPA